MKDRSSLLIILLIASGLMGMAPNAALGTSGEGGPCPTGGADCAPVPHNENYSVIVWDIFPIGSWSIGRCTGVDSCKCNNGEGIAAVGVVMVPKSTGSGRPVFICQDKDYYYWENGNDGFCGLTGMEHGSTGDPELGDLIDFSVPGTTPITGATIELTTEPAFYCPPPTPSPWQGEPTEAAQGFVHVYEVNLEATPQGNGAAIEWSITQFSGSASGDVTPNHLILKVTDGVNEAVGGLYSGWSGSENWDGNWAGGGSWDGCGQVTISLEVAPIDPNNPPPRYGIPSILINDEFCGTWEYYNHPVSKSICFPCTCEAANLPPWGTWTHSVSTSCEGDLTKAIETAIQGIPGLSNSNLTCSLSLSERTGACCMGDSQDSEGKLQIQASGTAHLELKNAAIPGWSRSDDVTLSAGGFSLTATYDLGPFWDFSATLGVQGGRRVNVCCGEDCWYASSSLGACFDVHVDFDVIACVGDSCAGLTFTAGGLSVCASGNANYNVNYCGEGVAGDVTAGPVTFYATFNVWYFGNYQLEIDLMEEVQLI